jgi:hypothetical protein
MKFVGAETTKVPLTNRNVWNALGFERMVDYWEVAIFKAAKQYFPHVRGSEWAFTKWTSDYCVPDPESNMGCRTPGHTGAVPGGDANGFSTHMMYDSFNEAGNWAQDPIPYVLKEFFGVENQYPRTPFNIIRVSLLLGRSMVLGGRAGVAGKGEGAIPTPAKPWMGSQNYGWPFVDNDFYQELWFQLAASGVGQFYYFAPWDPHHRMCAVGCGATIKDHELVHKMLNEMTTVMGCNASAGERDWITDLNIRWQDDFLLSGSTIGLSTANTSQRVWRFTPLDPTAFMPKATWQKGSEVAGASSLAIPVNMHLFGKLRPCVLGFEQAILRASCFIPGGSRMLSVLSSLALGVVYH